MLYGLDLRVRAFAPDNTGFEIHCRPCTVAKLGEPCVARLEVGLSTGSGWQVEHQHAIDEFASDRGYDCAEAGACGAPEYCADCAGIWCEGCGARLDALAEVVA
jgi:hypothetical protein